MAIIILIIALSVLAGVRAGYGRQEDDQYSELDLGPDLYGNNEDTPKYRDWDPAQADAAARVKRYKSKRRRDNENVKGALKEILSGRNIDELFAFQSDVTTQTHTASRSYKQIDKARGDSETNSGVYNLVKHGLATNAATRSKDPLESDFMELIDETQKAEDETSNAEGETQKHDGETQKDESETLNAEGETQKAESDKKEKESNMAVQPNKQLGSQETARTVAHMFLLREGDRQFLREDTTSTLASTSENATCPIQPTCPGNTTTTTSTVLTTTTLPPKFDIPALMDIISNFTYDWLQNLTRQVNETLQKRGIPTCPVPSTTEPTTLETTELILPNMTGTTMAKCYVCGLERPQIPRDSSCADAFAGDFLPLVPVDPLGRSKLASFKKYCTYNEEQYRRPLPVIAPEDRETIFRMLDISDDSELPSPAQIKKQDDQKYDTRRVHGPWTGGCAVRWVDLTGIYTQRTCRNRFKPMMGWHVVSKRMALLEKALRNVDNGCIISPAASLVPVSRGISLYARVHACVCTGNWCNRASLNLPWISYIEIISIYITKDIINRIFL